MLNVGDDSVSIFPAHLIGCTIQFDGIGKHSKQQLLLQENVFTVGGSDPLEASGREEAEHQVMTMNISSLTC